MNEYAKQKKNKNLVTMFVAGMKNQKNRTNRRKTYSHSYLVKVQLATKKKES